MYKHSDKIKLALAEFMLHEFDSAIFRNSVYAKSMKIMKFKENLTFHLKRTM